MLFVVHVVDACSVIGTGMSPPLAESSQTAADVVLPDLLGSAASDIPGGSGYG